MMTTPRVVLGYHGCDEAVAKELLAGEPFKASQNEYDWLGEGTYFWEFGYDRAFRFAEMQKRRGNISTPAVVGAVIHLGHCFDLLDTKFTADLASAYKWFKASTAADGLPMPENSGKKRNLDCAVINMFLSELAENGEPYQTVRCAFQEGGPAFDGSGILRESHIQIAVRDASCIVGVFRPTMMR